MFPIVENRMEKNMGHEAETGIMQVLGLWVEDCRLLCKEFSAAGWLSQYSVHYDMLACRAIE